MKKIREKKAKVKRVLIQLRTDETDKNQLVEFAKLSGMTLTDFIKSRTLDKPPRIKVANYDREVLIRLLSELGRVGGNINQIAKAMHDKTYYSVVIKETYISQVLADMRALSNCILAELQNTRAEQRQEVHTDANAEDIKAESTV